MYGKRKNGHNKQKNIMWSWASYGKHGNFWGLYFNYYYNVLFLINLNHKSSKVICAPLNCAYKKIDNVKAFLIQLLLEIGLFLFCIYLQWTVCIHFCNNLSFENKKEINKYRTLDKEGIWRIQQLTKRRISNVWKIDFVAFWFDTKHSVFS